MKRVLKPRVAASFTQTIQQLQQDVHEGWHHDTFDVWTVNRSAGWADGAGVEAQVKVASDVGRLYANGAGGPQAGEMVINIESPYLLRTVASAPIESGHLLVINGTRLFRVDVAKPEGVDNLLMDVYLTELFSTPMPEEAP